jgi:hypothetical protein
MIDFGMEIEKGVSRAQKHALHKDKEEEKTC